MSFVKYKDAPHSYCIPLYLLSIIDREHIYFLNTVHQCVLYLLEYFTKIFLTVGPITIMLIFTVYFSIMQLLYIHFLAVYIFHIIVNITL